MSRSSIAIIEDYNQEISRLNELVANIIVQFKYSVGDQVWFRGLDGWEVVQVLQKRVHYGLPAYRIEGTDRVIYETELKEK